MIAYRYRDHSVYYTLEGEQVGSYAGAVGFFEDGILLCQSPGVRPVFLCKGGRQPCLCGRVPGCGVRFPAAARSCRRRDGIYLAIDTAGSTLYTLESGHYAPPT